MFKTRTLLPACPGLNRPEPVVCATGRKARRGFPLAFRSGLASALLASLICVPASGLAGDTPSAAKSAAAKGENSGPALPTLRPELPEGTILPPEKTADKIRIDVGPWQGGGEVHSFSGRFVECSARARFAQSITVRMSLSRLNDFVMDLYSPWWMLEVGERYASGVLPDDGPQALVTDQQKVSLLFGGNLRGISRVLESEWMRIRLPVGVYELYLPGGAQALTALKKCVREALELEEQQKAFEESLKKTGPVARRGQHWCNPPRLQTLLKPAFRPEKTVESDEENSGEGEKAEPGPESRRPTLQDYVNYQSPDSLATRFLLRQAGLTRAEMVPANILHNRFPDAEIGWLVNNAFGFATRAPASVFDWDKLSADSLDPIAFNCQSPLQVDIHSGQTGGLGRLKRMFVTCADTEPGITFFVTLMERHDRKYLFMHCAETDFMDEAFESDEALANLLAAGLNGWMQ